MKFSQAINLDTDSYGYHFNFPSGVELGFSEKHTRHVTLSDGNTYSVELEMTLEHR